MSNETEFLTVMEKAENQRRARRNFIRLCGGAAAMTGGLSLLSACGVDGDNNNNGVGSLNPTPTPTATATTANIDVDILNFALQLEYLEANYYTYAVTGSGIATNLQTGTGTQGAVITGTGAGMARAVSFTDPIIAQYAREIAADEIAHVTFLRTALGSASASAQPAINLSGSASVTAAGATVAGAFTQAARAAGIDLTATGGVFDPFANDMNFLIGSYLLTDVGVTAYRGAAKLITSKIYLEASAGILSTEAYHDGVIRSELYRMGLTNDQIFTNVQKISDARDSLDGSLDTDQGIGTNGNANLVPADGNSLALGRNTNQVLNVVYLNANPGVSGGGFFPAGLNGTIRLTAANN